MGRSPSTGLPASMRDFKTPTQYPDVGNYKGWTGLSPSATYPLTVGYHHTKGSCAPEHYARVYGNYLYPPGLQPYRLTRNNICKPEGTTNRHPNPSSTSTHTNHMND
jgi:hypothetical protein